MIKQKVVRCMQSRLHPKRCPICNWFYVDVAGVHNHVCPAKHFEDRAGQASAIGQGRMAKKQGRRA